jgi:hypothetical protein
MSGRHGSDGGRRQLTYAVLLCLVGAGLAVFAATRTWAVELTARPDPLPDVRVTRTGGELLLWLPALAVVGLAGAGAVLAGRGIGRRLVGALLLLVGLGVAGGGAYGVLGLARGGVGPAWPALAALGGLLAAAGGTRTAARGHTWPVMGARYERAGGTEPDAGRKVGAAGGTPPGSRRTGEFWAALDRGEDPTAD